MERRELLGLLGTAGVVATAGCSTVAGSEPLSDPTVHDHGPGRRSLQWSSDGERVGEFGVFGSVSNGLLDVSTELNHDENTHVESIDLRVWMESPDTDTPADVAVVSPVEGDSSPPPSLSLYSPKRARGTAISITDLDDLKDETISTIELLVEPRSETATTLKIDTTIELTGTGVLGTDYSLDGQLQLEFPELSEG